ncbi:DUF445 family protein [Natribacillus halophilus]|uniref:Uncharacterized membrane protein YheB, UPF0754 family n=1 Tax=Natribacillus halophilus TaxID=549003 RepID=A0A1G8NV74_9BACI|nr:DUF445 family protein [Natribacillus halophilus]SDI84107.1 Uncharacterized membrane protein YheB, UPF0754 family [Natribacillus halophilus]
MNGWLLLLFTVILAAIIGFITNVIAVSMLFRPRKPIYVGAWKLPLTPGLIPKRHEEIAQHLGRIVMEHLLTVEGVQGRLTEQRFQNEVKEWVKEGVKKWMGREERSVQDIIGEYGPWSSPDRKVKERVAADVARRVDAYWEQMQNETLEQMLPADVVRKGSDMIPSVSHWIIQRLSVYLHSREGKEQIQSIVQTFVRSRGSLVQFLDSFVRTDKVVERVYPEVIDVLTSREIEQWLEKKLHEEYQKALRKDGTDIFSEETIARYRQEVIRLLSDQVPVDRIFHTPVKEWAETFNVNLVDELVDTAVHQSGRFLETRIADILPSLRLDHIVTEQVRAFPLDRLEAIVVQISNRELRMIKYLGGLLGGVIGIVQGIMILLFF